MRTPLVSPVVAFCGWGGTGCGCGVAWTGLGATLSGFLFSRIGIAVGSRGGGEGLRVRRRLDRLGRPLLGLLLFRIGDRGGLGDGGGLLLGDRGGRGGWSLGGEDVVGVGGLPLGQRDGVHHRRLDGAVGRGAVAPIVAVVGVEVGVGEDGADDEAVEQD